MSMNGIYHRKFILMSKIATFAGNISAVLVKQIYFGNTLR